MSESTSMPWLRANGAARGNTDDQQRLETIISMALRRMSRQKAKLKKLKRVIKYSKAENAAGYPIYPAADFLFTVSVVKEIVYHANGDLCENLAAGTRNEAVRDLSRVAAGGLCDRSAPPLRVHACADRTQCTAQRDL